MAKPSYYVEISNEYLGKYKRVTGRTPREVQAKSTEQLLRWYQEEERARERAALADLKERSELATEDALARIEEHRGILAATLAVDDRIDWADLEDRDPYPGVPPTPEEVAARMGVPERRPLMEKLRPSLVAKREEAERAAREELGRLTREHEEAERRHEEERAARNAEVEAFRQDYEAGEPEAVERYVSLVLANSAYPEGFPREFGVQYRPDERTAVVDMELPSPEAVPRVVQYRYVASRKAVDEVPMKDKDFQRYYVRSSTRRCSGPSTRSSRATTPGCAGRRSSTAGCRGWTPPRARTSARASPRARPRGRASPRSTWDGWSRRLASGSSRAWAPRGWPPSSRWRPSAGSNGRIPGSSRPERCWTSSRRGAT